MERTKPELDLLTSTSEVTVDFRDATLVCVEYASRCGFLISRNLSTSDLDSSITLGDTLYLSGDGQSFKLASFDRIIVSSLNGIWTAVDTDTIETIPVPSSTPYPLIAISDHGFDWFRNEIASESYSSVWNHLLLKFKSSELPSPYCETRRNLNE